MLVSYLLLALPLFLLLIVQRYKRDHAPPGPLGLPVIGNLHQIDTNNTHIYLWKLSKKYGSLMSLKFGTKKVVVISSARFTQEAFKTHDLVFSDRPVHDTTRKLTYDAKNMLFSPYNYYWRVVRKVSTHRLFSIKQVQSFHPIREDEVARVMEKISAYASEGKIVNLTEIITSLTMSLICRVAFGKRFDEEGLEGRRFKGLIREYMALLEGLYLSNYVPWLGWINNFTGTNQRLEMTMKRFDSFIQELIDEHLNPDRPEPMKQDILTLLLQLREDESFPIELTMNHLKALILDVFVGGTDTSATTIIWAMTALIKAPRIMKNAQTEIRGLVSKQGMITEDNIQNFHYLKAVIKETLRFYPPAPLLLPRETREKCNINGYEIQPKTTLFVNAWAVARDPEYWENPDEFFPERFLQNTIDYKGNHFGFVPFGAGRRSCPGINFGTATIELTLANLLYSFDWELPPGINKEEVDTEASPGVIMAKKNPLDLLAKIAP